MRYIRSFLFAVTTLFIASTTGLALAQVVVPPAGTGPVPASPDPASIAGALLSAIQGKHWGIAVGLGLSGVVWLLRNKIAPNWKAVQTDRGGAILTLATALVATIGAELAGGVMSVTTILDAVLAAMTAAGGFSLIKKIVSPSDQPAQAPAVKPGT